jgi:O-antigen ligase
MSSQRARFTTIFWLVIALLALLGMGALKQRQDFLTRGIPDGLPQPIAEGGAQLGINVALEQYDNAALDENLSQIHDAGIEAVKQSFYFSEAFDWAASDRLVTAVTNHNLTLVPLLDGNPDNDFAPINPEQFAAWAGQFAARYSEKIQATIIWDEPNLASHWGNQPVNAIEYAALLTAAANAIRAVDPGAVIVAAPLAPTQETGPQNLADPLYLQSLYEAGAADAFDVAAGKPYGFDTGPDDRAVDLKTLNFSRAILLREVMERNGDGEKALWAGNWGWNSLPADWTGSPSLWGQTDAQTQVARTAAALERASQEWPWIGFMFLENWEPNAPEDDPHWGFSVKSKLETRDWRLEIDQSPVSNLQSPTAYPGFHLASPLDPAQVYEGGWRFSSEFGADISEALEGEPPDSMTFIFWGTDVGLRVRRANFRARLYITVDGQPANALPRDENGAALVLTAADPNEDYITTELVAQDLAPGVHTMEIVAARGWDQWALNGFSVGYHPPDAGYRWGMMGLGVTAVLTLLLALYANKKAEWGPLGQKMRDWYGRLQQTGQLILTALVAAIVALTGWLTWGEQAAGLYRRLGDGSQLALTAAAASIFYVTPSFFIYVTALAILFLLIYFRPAWGLALIALTIPFYTNSGSSLVPALLQPKPIFHYRFSPVEIYTLLTLAAFGISRFTFHVSRSPFHPFSPSPLHAADYAVITFTAVATLSLFFTERLGVATNEWRVVIIEPALFYLLLRGIRPTKREMWVVLDAFVLGGLIVSLFGLGQYAFARDTLITAEGGLLRLRSIYGSPNNVALYLGRILPLLVAMALLGKGNGRRRWFYATAALPIGLAILLSFSKGALFLGLPASLLFVFWVWQRTNRRKTWPWVIGLGAAGIAFLFLAQQIPQLAGRFDLRGATGAFRLNLWRASLNMIAEHPLLGVGLDNFLYAYRGRYILDAAWREPNLNHPHNIILDFATRLGLLGLVAGSWLVSRLGWLLWPARQRVSPLWLPVVVGFGGALVDMLAHGLVDHSFFLVDLAFAFYLMLGTAVWVTRPKAMD